MLPMSTNFDFTWNNSVNGSACFQLECSDVVTFHFMHLTIDLLPAVDNIQVIPSIASTREHTHAKHVFM